MAGQRETVFGQSYMCRVSLKVGLVPSEGFLVHLFRKESFCRK